MRAGTLREAVERLAELYEFADSSEPEIAGQPPKGAARDLRALLANHHDDRGMR